MFTFLKATNFVGESVSWSSCSHLKSLPVVPSRSFLSWRNYYAGHIVRVAGPDLLVEREKSITKYSNVDLLGRLSGEVGNDFLENQIYTLNCGPPIACVIPSGLPVRKLALKECPPYAKRVSSRTGRFSIDHHEALKPAQTIEAHQRSAGGFVIFI